MYGNKKQEKILNLNLIYAMIKHLNINLSLQF